MKESVREKLISIFKEIHEDKIKRIFKKEIPDYYLADPDRTDSSVCLICGSHEFFGIKKNRSCLNCFSTIRLNQEYFPNFENGKKLLIDMWVDREIKIYDDLVTKFKEYSLDCLLKISYCERYGIDIEDLND